MILSLIPIICSQVRFNNKYFLPTNQITPLANVPNTIQTGTPNLLSNIPQIQNTNLPVQIQTLNNNNGYRNANNPVKRLKVVTNQPQNQIRASYLTDSTNGNQSLSATFPLPSNQKSQQPMRNMPSYPPKNIPKSPIRQRGYNASFPDKARVIFPPNINQNAYMSIPTLRLTNTGTPSINQQKYILSPLYFPKTQKTENVPVTYYKPNVKHVPTSIPMDISTSVTDLEDPATKVGELDNEIARFSDEIELNEPIMSISTIPKLFTSKKRPAKKTTASVQLETMTVASSITLPPSVEIEPYGLEVSSPDVDKEIDEDLFNGEIQETPVGKLTKSPSRIIKQKKTTSKFPRTMHPASQTRSQLPVKTIKTLEDLINEASSDFLIPEDEIKISDGPEKSISHSISAVKTHTSLKAPFYTTKESKSAPDVSTVTETKIKTEVQTTTTTEVVETQAPVVETSSYVPTKEEIERETKELTANIVPRIAGKKFLRKHNENILTADKSRKAYIDYKLEESRNNQKKIDDRLAALKELEEKLGNKLKKLADKRAEINQDTTASKNSVENNESAIKTLQKDQKLNEKLLKLEEQEINKLEKAINEERNKYMILEDQGKMYTERISNFGKKDYDTKTEMKINCNKLEEYDKLLASIRKDAENLRMKIQEIEKQKRREIDMQNKLAIERKDIEDSNHLSLMAIYD